MKHIMSLFAVAASLITVFHPLPADAFNYSGCKRVPSCHVSWRYVSKPYYQNVCQYYGSQRSCYVRTSYRQVPVGTNICTYSNYCPGGFNGMLRRY